MFAVVLVGGFGTRLRPLTLDTPKPMLPVANRPMIVRLVEHLAASGVTDVVLALGFRPEPFTAAFPEGVHAGARLHYAVEPEPLDTAGAIAFAARAVSIDETFVVVNGDVLTDLDLASLVATHRSAGAMATLHLTPVDDPSAFGVVEVDPDGTIRRFIEKPAPGETDANLINAGSYVLEPDVLDLIPAGRRVSVEREIFPQIVAAGRAFGLATDDYWIDAGRPDFYLAANLDLINGARPTTAPAIARTAVIEGDISQSVVGDRATIGAGAVVTRSVILPGANIGPNAIVNDSIVAGSVGHDAKLERCVIGSTGIVEPGAGVVDECRPPADSMIGSKGSV